MLHVYYSFQAISTRTLSYKRETFDAGQIQLNQVHRSSLDFLVRVDEVTDSCVQVQKHGHRATKITLVQITHLLKATNERNNFSSDGLL